jgi:hypothetical protein
MNIRSWYRGLKVPHRFGTEAIEFANNVMGIFTSVMANEFGTKVSVKFVDDAPSIAFCSINEKYIGFDINLFNIDETKRPVKGDIETVLAVVLGVTLHECLHFKHTTMTKEEICNFLEIKPNQIIMNLFNILEDIYIDNWGWKKFQHLRWFTTALNDSLLNQKDFDDLVKKLNENGPTNMQELTDWLNALCHLTHRDLKVPSHSPIKFLKMAKKTLSVYDMPNILNRATLTKEIYNELIENIEKENSKSEQQSESGNGSDSKEDNESKDFSDVEIDLERMIIESISNDLKIDDDTEFVDCEIKFCEGENFKVIEIVAEKLEMEKIFCGDIVPTDINVQFDKRYVGLSQMIQSRSSQNRPYGLQNNSGTHIRQLHRIATDGKVLTRKVKMDFVGPQEVIILVDCSYSMMTNQNGQTRIQDAMAATLGAVKGLESGRHRVAVYGHTASLVENTGDDENIVVYRFKGFDESINLLQKRMDMAISNARSFFSDNADSVAIEVTAQHFSELDNQKTLIVISDGAPMARIYGGGSGYSILERGIRETKESVAKVRKMGINVLSISISKDAEVPNNEIYGSNKNVFNMSANVITTILNKLFN